MSMYHEFTKDFVERTLENLKYIEEAEKEGRSTYEVTQLINSFLGLIVFPQEQDEEKIRKVEIDQKIIDDLSSGVMENTYTGQHKKVNLESTVYHFRNANSHGHVEPHADRNKEISVLYFHDFIQQKPTVGFRIDCGFEMRNLYVVHRIQLRKRSSQAVHRCIGLLLRLRPGHRPGLPCPAL